MRGFSLVPSAEDAKKHQEKVDKIQVQAQGADDRPFSLGIETVEAGVGHGLYLLRVIGGESDKYNDSSIGNEPGATSHNN